MKRSTRTVRRSVRGSRLVAAAAGSSFEGAPPCDDAQSAKPKPDSSAECVGHMNRRICSQRTTRSASSAKSAADVSKEAAGGGRPSRRNPPSHHPQKVPALSAPGGKKRGAPDLSSATAAPAAAAVGTTPGKAAGTGALGSLASPQRRRKMVNAKAATAGRRQGKEETEQHTAMGGEVSLADGEAAMLATLLSPIAGREPKAEGEDQLEEWRTPAKQPQDDSGGSGGVSARCPLESMFSALEQMLPVLRRRRQATLFKQVRGAVEGLCGRTFTRQHLARIVFVQPDAYKISSQTDARPTRGGYRLRDLLIEIGPGGVEGSKKIEEESERGVPGGGAGDGAREGAGKCGGGREGGGGGGRSESVSEQRTRVFRRLLVSARARYCQCAKKNGSSENGENNTADDHNECTCLPEASLPDTSPLPVEGDAGGARPDKGGGGEPCKGGTAAGTDAAGNPSTPSLSAQGLSAHGLAASGAFARTGGDAEGWDAVQGVDALRERLRAKDARIALERNKSGEEKEADRRRKGKLPATADAVRSFFAHSRRVTCSLDALAETLSSSSRHSLSDREARERVRMIADIVPEWCSIVAPPPPPGSGKKSDVSVVGQAQAHAYVHSDVDDGMVARPMKAKEVVRINTRIQFKEVREMIVFMAGGGGEGGRG